MSRTGDRPLQSVCSPCAASLTPAALCPSRGIRYDSSSDSGRYTNVSWNHIHDCGCGGDDCLSDGGGLDGMNTGSVLPVYLEHNWVHHINAHHFGTLPQRQSSALMC